MPHNASRLGRLSSSCLSSLNPDSCSDTVTEGPLKLELSWAWPGGSHLAEAAAAHASAHWGRAATAPGRTTGIRWQWPAPGFAWCPAARALASASARPWHAAPTVCQSRCPTRPQAVPSSSRAGKRRGAPCRRPASDCQCPPGVPAATAAGRGRPGPGARAPGTPSHWHPPSRARTLRLKFKIFESGRQPEAPLTPRAHWQAAHRASVRLRILLSGS
jgi:hypothetical protein